MRHQVEALRILIIGTVGTKKSYLIKTIRSWLCKIAGSWSKSPVAMIAPIGVVAFNINRETIHLILFISIINNKKLKLDSIHLKQL